MQPLIEANRLRRDDVWFSLNEFFVAVVNLQLGLERLILASIGRSLEDDDDDGEPAGELEVGDGLDDQDDADAGEGTSTARGAVPDAGSKTADLMERPATTTREDWNVYVTVRDARMDFETKFKQMWA